MSGADGFRRHVEWTYNLRSVCQSFYCTCMNTDRAEFNGAIVWLADAAPPPETLQESEVLKDRLKLCAFETGTVFHQDFHRRTGRRSCQGSPVEAALSVWACHEFDARRTLRTWARVFFERFDAAHTVSAAERAAGILRERVADPPGLDSLALAVGASRSALTQDFRRRYGISCGEYLTRLRLRQFVTTMLDSTAQAGQLAEQAGFRRYQGLYEALRRRTGVRPSEVRSLTLDQLRELLDRLALAPADGRRELRTAFRAGRTQGQTAGPTAAASSHAGVMSRR